MSQASRPARRKPKPKGLKNPATLIALIAITVVTLILAVVMIHDAQISSDCDNSSQALVAAMSKKNEKKVSRDDVKKYLYGSPTRRRNKEGTYEVFTWKGIITSHSFRVDYDSYGDVERIRPE